MKIQLGHIGLGHIVSGVTPEQNDTILYLPLLRGSARLGGVL